MYDFKKTAIESQFLSPLMAGRKKLTTAELLEKALTIIEFDCVNASKDDDSPNFAVLVFEELPDYYYCGGIVLQQICKNWEKDLGGCEKANQELKAYGGVKVQLSLGKTSSGKTITNVLFL